MPNVVKISKKMFKSLLKAPRKYNFWSPERVALMSRLDKITSRPRPALFNVADFRRPLFPTEENKAGVLVDDVRGLIVIRDGSRHRLIDINDEKAAGEITEALRLARLSTYTPSNLVEQFCTPNLDALQRQAMESRVQHSAAASPLSMAGLSGMLGISLIE